MATNFFFQSGLPMGRRSESLLHEDLIIECLKMMGFDTYYIPRSAVNRDFILGEDPVNKFVNAYAIEAYLENITGFGGNDLMTKFGVELNDSATFIIARRRWEELIQRKGTSVLSTRPAEGDLLFFPSTKTFFEIRLVEATDPFFQVGKLYVYKLQCEIFQFAHENIETNVQEIDDAVAPIATTIKDYELELESGDALLLEMDEKSSMILEDYSTIVIDRGAENEKFNDEALAILDFSERNPFGEVYNR